MKSTRYVFTVSQNPGHEDKAIAAARYFFPADNVESAILVNSHTLYQLDEDNQRHLVFVGPGYNDRFGDYTASQFAEQLDKAYGTKMKVPKKKHAERRERVLAQNALIEESKQKVLNVHLLGCNAGTVISDRDALPQQIANELFNRGFINVKVHCVAKPEHAKGCEISINVAGVEKPSKMGTLFAQINYPDNRHDEYFNYIDYSDPVSVLRKPQNIFIPNESKSARKKRLQMAASNSSVAGKGHVIKSLERCINSLKPHEKHSTYIMTVRKLKIIITQLTMACEDEWLNVLSNARQFFASHPQMGANSSIPGSIATNFLNTCYEQQHAAFLVAQQSIPQPVAVQALALAPALALSPLTANDNNADDHASDHEGQFSVPHAAGVEEQQEQQPEHSVQPQLDAVKAHTYGILREHIQTRITRLDTERANWSSGCKGVFFSGKVQTKQTKRDALQSLLDQPSYELFQQRAEALRNDKKVMSGIFFKGTSSLIEASATAQAAANKK